MSEQGERTELDSSAGLKSERVPPKAYLGRAAHDYDLRRFRSEAGADIHARELGLFLSALGRVPTGGSVLDVGCGTGRFLEVASDAGLICHGVDPSTDMLAIVKDKFAARKQSVELQQAEGGALPFEGGQFDLVYSIRVLNKTESEAYSLAMIGEMFRVAKPGALVLVEFVNRARPSNPRSGAGVVRLAVNDVIRAGKLAGGEPVQFEGAFLFGMTAMHRAPGRLRPAIRAMDEWLASIFPRYCARCYVLFRRQA